MQSYLYSHTSNYLTIIACVLLHAYQLFNYHSNQYLLRKLPNRFLSFEQCVNTKQLSHGSRWSHTFELSARPQKSHLRFWAVGSLWEKCHFSSSPVLCRSHRQHLNKHTIRNDFTVGGRDFVLFRLLKYRQRVQMVHARGPGEKNCCLGLNKFFCWLKAPGHFRKRIELKFLWWSKKNHWPL